MKRILLTAALGLLAAGLHAQVVSTFSGTGDSSFSENGIAVKDAKYAWPYGLAMDSKGNIWVTDEMNSGIVLLTSGGKYYKREGYNDGGYKDGSGTGGSLLTYPKSIVVGANDTLYFVDNGNSAIRRIAPLTNVGNAQKLTTIAGGGDPGSGGGFGLDGYEDAKGFDARFAGPMGIAISPDKSYLVVSDQYNGLLRKVVIQGADYGKVTTLAGQYNSMDLKDGDALTQATFAYPEGLAISSNGDIYIADNSGGVRLLSGGKVTTIISGDKIESPSAVLQQGDYLYIGNGCSIKRYNLKTKTLINLAGSPNFVECGYKDGRDSVARFQGVRSFILSSDKKSLLVADGENNRIRQVTLPTSTAIDEISGDEVAFTVYPNPASQVINITKSGNNSGNINVAIYDLAGRQLSLNSLNSQGERFQVNIEQLPVGIYMLRIEGQGFSTTQRVVISR